MVHPSGRPSVFKLLLTAPVADPASVTTPAKRSAAEDVGVPLGPEAADVGAVVAEDAVEVPGEKIKNQNIYIMNNI